MNFKTNYLKFTIIVGLCLTTLFAQAQTPDPNTTVVCEGQKRTLTSEVTGTSYQWYKDGDLITGAIGKSYDAPGANPGAKYAVVAINEHGCASDASDPITVVTAPVATPKITMANNSTCVKNEVVLTGSGVPAANTVGLTYITEWRKVSSGAVVGTSSTLTLSNVAETGEYTFTITPVWKSKNMCPVTSARSTVTIHPFAAKATISTVISGYQNEDEKRAGIVCEFNTVTFNASVSSSDPNITTSGLTYQWYKDGIIMTGKTTPTLVLSNVGSIDNANYTVRTKTATSCEVISDAAVIDVKARLGKPTISFED